MAFISIPNGLLFPAMLPAHHRSTALTIGTSLATVDAAAEKCAIVGRIRMRGRESGAKTISSSGGKIHFRTGAVTWATSGTTLRVGIQDLDASSPAVPDGTFDVYDDLVQGTDTISANTWTTATMSSGTKDLSHGDVTSVVMDLTTRNGSDSIGFLGNTMSVFTQLCYARQYTTSWQNAGNVAPICVIEFDDGTLATFDVSLPISASTLEQYDDSSDPDERGVLFRVPFPCKVDGLWYWVGNSGVNMDCKLYSDPTGSPSALATVSITNEVLGTTNERFLMAGLASEVTLAANTDYVVAIKATEAGANLNLRMVEIASSSYLPFFGASTFKKATRNGGSGAFSTTDDDFYEFGVRVSAVDCGVSPIYQLGI